MLAFSALTLSTFNAKGNKVSAKVVMTQEQKDAATAAAKETRDMQTGSEFLGLVAKHKAAFETLVTDETKLFIGVRDQVSLLIDDAEKAVGKLDGSDKSRKFLMLVVNACLSGMLGTVRQYAAWWISIHLAERNRLKIGFTVKRQDTSGEWGDVTATGATIDGVAEAKGMATSCNKALGVKPRNKRQAAPSTAIPATVDTVYDVLGRLLDDPVAFTRIKSILASKGYAIVTAIEASMIHHKSIPAQRSVRKAA